MGHKANKMRHGWMVVALGLLALATVAGCKRDDGKINCTVYWQLYQRPKHATAETIEKAYQDAFFGFWRKVNDNTVVVENTTRSDARALTLRLAQLAHNEVTESLDPSLGYGVEVKVFVDYNGAYTEEVWDMLYE